MTPGLFIAEDRHTSAADLAYSSLRREILTGRLAADTPINQIRFANELGISRVPVRDALQRLESEGLITVLPNRRAVVTKLTLNELREIFEIRAVLEGLCARRAFANITKDDMRELKAMVAAMLRAEDTDTYLVKHEAFHNLLAERSGMPRLRKELVRFRQMIMPYIRILGSDGTAELRSNTHSSLVAALEVGNADEIDVAFRDHVKCAFEEMEGAIRQLTRDAKPDISMERRSGQPARNETRI